MSSWAEDNTDGLNDDNEDLLDNEELQALEETIEGPEQRGSEVRLRRSEAEDKVARYYRIGQCCLLGSVVSTHAPAH